MSVTHLLFAYGPVAVFLGMVGESLGVPFIPSEIALPFAGWLVASGRIGFAAALLLVLLAQLVGSLIGYGIGFVGGRPLLRAIGRWTRRDELAASEAWFGRYGASAVFWGRFLPVVRTFISWPAGLARMGIGRFMVLTFFGSLPWSAALIWAGVRLRSSWEKAGGPVGAVGTALVVIIVLLILYLVARRLLGHAEDTT